MVRELYSGRLWLLRRQREGLSKGRKAGLQPWTRDFSAGSLPGNNASNHRSHRCLQGQYKYSFPSLRGQYNTPSHLGVTVPHPYLIEIYGQTKQRASGLLLKGLSPSPRILTGQEEPEHKADPMNGHPAPGCYCTRDLGHSQPPFEAAPYPKTSQLYQRQDSGGEVKRRNKEH